MVTDGSDNIAESNFEPLHLMFVAQPTARIQISGCFWFDKFTTGGILLLLIKRPGRRERPGRGYALLNRDRD
jgi:hypothetical protein